MSTTSPPTVVTVSAPYGAGGSVIGPRVAEALGVPFLDRAIPTGVAERLSMPLDEALEQDECPPHALDRLLHSFASLGPAVVGTPMHVDLSQLTVADATEHVIRERIASGGGVVLGRAGQVVLKDRPGTLHVRLGGPADRRVAQAMEIEGVDRATAERRLEQTDRAREQYLRQFYGADAKDASLYHLMLDSTAIDVDVCVAVIVQAARALHAGALAAAT